MLEGALEFAGYEVKKSQKGGEYALVNFALMSGKVVTFVCRQLDKVKELKRHTEYLVKIKLDSYNGKTQFELVIE